MNELGESHSCNGGAFFWVAEHDVGGSWSSTVGNAIFPNAGCSLSPTSHAPSTPTPPTPTPPTPTPPTPPSPTPPSPTPSIPCGDGNIGNGVCVDGTCCSQWGWCGTTSDHCNILILHPHLPRLQHLHLPRLQHLLLTQIISMTT